MQNICKLKDLYEMKKTDESVICRKASTVVVENCNKTVFEEGIFILKTKAFNKMAKITNLKLNCKLKLTLCLKFVKVVFNVALSFVRIV